MANSKVAVIETVNYDDIEPLINANIAAEEANGFGISDVQITNYTDPLDGSPKRIAALTYNKVSASTGGGSSNTQAPIASLAELRAVPTTTLADCTTLFYCPELAFYYFDSASFLPDNPPAVVRPDDVPNDASPGRWLPVPGAGGGGPSPNNVEAFEIPFSYNTASPLLLYNYTAGDTMIDFEIVIETAFDDPTATLEIGPDSDPDGIYSAAMNIPDQVGIYANRCNVSYPANEAIRLTITPGTSTQGSGHVVINVRTN